jgi:CRISPR type IV-associated protein Csf3
MTAFVPLQVHATLTNGIATSAPWGIALDGLLASVIWQDTKSGLADNDQPVPSCRDNQNPPDLPLPLARCTGAEDWHWSATCAYPTGQPTDLPPEQRLWTTSQDQRALEAITDHLPKNLPDRQGRYRARATPTLVINATALAWQAIGDPTRIEQLLHQLTWIGKRRHTGEGRVAKWTITERPDLDPFTAAHLHPNGDLGRPTPLGCLSGCDVNDGGVGLAAIRPPNQHPARRRVLVLPVAMERT